MDTNVEIVSVGASNLAERGFFCRKSKRKTEGYRQKLDWLEQRLSEGLQIKMLYENGRSVGFIEYVPGAFTWRAVNAAGYLVIHCLWVVGRAKKKGYGSRLVNICVDDARKMGKHGIAMVTSRRNWLAGSSILLKNGFEVVDQAPPSFELLVKKLADAPSPTFPRDWDKRLGHYGSGLTIVRSGQCAYINNAVKAALETAHEAGVEAKVIELESCQHAQELAPSAYGVFNMVYDGKLLAYQVFPSLTTEDLHPPAGKHQD